MSEMPFENTKDTDDDLLPEYHFDYQKAKPNRFAIQSETQPITIVLDEDVARIFTTSEAVNKVLRALIESMPKTSNCETT